MGRRQGRRDWAGGSVPAVPASGLCQHQAAEGDAAASAAAPALPRHLSAPSPAPPQPPVLTLAPTPWHFCLQEAGAHPISQRTGLLGELVREALEARAEDDPHRSPRAVQLRGPLSVQGKRNVRALSAREVAASARFQRRHSPGCTELIYMYDGDHNGVCW